VRLAVSIFLRSCLGVSIFRKAKGLEVPIRSFICVYKWRIPASLDFEFQWSNLQIFREKFNPNFSQIVLIPQKGTKPTAKSVLALEKQLFFSRIS